MPSSLTWIGAGTFSLVFLPPLWSILSLLSAQQPERCCRRSDHVPPLLPALRKPPILLIIKARVLPELAPIIPDLVSSQSCCPARAQGQPYHPGLVLPADGPLCPERLLHSPLCGWLLASFSFSTNASFSVRSTQTCTTSPRIPIPLTFLHFPPWHLTAPSILCNLFMFYYLSYLRLLPPPRPGLLPSLIRLCDLFVAVSPVPRTLPGK